MKLPKIESEGNKQILSILDQLGDGTLRVPRFQRNFVWERNKILALLDSIFKEYPIGSFFLWETKGKYNLFYRNLPELGITSPKPMADEKIKFILDGQQRICSLYAAWHGLKVEFKDGNKTKLIDCSQICLDLDYYQKEPNDDGNRPVFEVKQESSRYIPLYKVLGEDNLRIFRKLSPKRQEVFMECHRVFTTYPLSVVTVRNVELENATVIFERINQGGKKLSLFDLVVANTWGDDFDLKILYQELRDRIEEKYGFGKITPEVVTQAASLIINGYCRKSYQLQLTKKQLKDNWEEIVNSIELSVDYLFNNMGVKIFDFIPYPAMISLLAYLYFKLPGRSFNKTISEKVQEWFWKAALSDRYATSRETRMEEDRRLVFDKLVRTGEARINYPVTLDLERIERSKVSTKSALRNAFFCMLASRSPKHFKTNIAIPLNSKICSEFNSPEKHHIFPRHYLRKNNIPGEYLLANFCFIPAELNKEILNEKPSDYFERFDKENPDFKEALKSQLISYDESIKNNDYELFIKKRSRAIFEEFERLVGSKILQVAGHNANKAIDETEEKLRSLIDSVLLKGVGDKYWKESIPSDIQEKVKNKIGELIRKNPSRSEEIITDADRLDFCDIMDYSNIILKNWEHFEDFFGSKFEVEKRFVDLKDFRNAIKHNREVDLVLQKDGEAALEWFSQVLTKALKRIEKGEEIEEIKKTTIPSETDEEIIDRVKSEFVKKAVGDIRDWVSKEFPDGRIYIRKGAGSCHSLLQDGKLVLLYYFSQNWVYVNLQMTTDEELKIIRQKLTDPSSILERKDHYKQARFHVLNENDLKLVKNIIVRRFK